MAHTASEHASDLPPIEALGSVGTIILTQMEAAARYSSEAEEFIAACGQLLDVTFNVDIPKDLALTPAAGAVTTVENIIGRTSGTKPVRPEFPSLRGSTIPSAPSFEFTASSPVVVPPFEVGNPPAIEIPAPPSPGLPGVPVAPAVNEVAIPPPPTLEFPAAPRAVAVQLPSPPTMTLPTFSSSLPVDDLVAPSSTFAFAEQAYQSLLNDALKSKLLDALENGGYGIEPGDEQALWERARAREFASARSELDTLTREFASRGFPLRNGELNAATGRVVRGVYDRLGETNRTIALERAKLYVENRQFTIREAREVESLSLQFHTSLMERALNASKATFEASMAVYNSLVARYNARVNAYQAAAAVYEAEIRALATKAEIYRTQIAAAGLELEAQKQAVEVYKAQLEGLEAIVGIYRARMEAAGVQAQVERSRIDAFRGLVEAYGQQVQAKVAEFQGYEARVRGEVAKTDAYRSRIEAYKALAEATEAQARINVSNANLQTEQARARIAAYSGQIEGYKAQIEELRSAVSGLVDIYRADNDAYTAAIELARKAREAYIAEVDMVNRNRTLVQEANLRAAQLKFEELRAAADIKKAGSQFGASYYAQVAAAAYGAINATASFGASISTQYEYKGAIK